MKLYVCHRCGATNRPHLSFETGWPRRSRYWCLHHVPRLARIRMRMRGID